jgi:hypothetical protein
VLTTVSDSAAPERFLFHPKRMMQKINIALGLVSVIGLIGCIWYAANGPTSLRNVFISAWFCLLISLTTLQLFYILRKPIQNIKKNWTFWFDVFFLVVLLLSSLICSIGYATIRNWSAFGLILSCFS